MRRRPGVTLTEVVVVLGIVLILYAMIAPAVFSARLRGREAACASNMRQTWQALQAYRDDYGEFPNFRPPEQLQPQYVRSPQVLVCPAEHRMLSDLDVSSPGHKSPAVSSYLWPCIPGKERAAVYARRRGETPALICPVHAAISSGAPFYHVLRHSGDIDRVPLSRLLKLGGTSDL